MASSSSQKLQRQLYGPSLAEVTIGAALSVIIGGLLAATYLIAQPVETVRVMPREPNPDKVYYVFGSARSSAGSQWLRKKQLLMEPGEVRIELSEDELNTWLSSAQTKTEGEDGARILAPQKMNLRVADDRLQIGLPCDLNLAGLSRSLVVQVRGGFTQRGDQFVYEADEVMVGHLAVHRLPMIGGFVVDRLEAMHTAPEELKAAWATLTDVTVAGNKLVLVR